MKLESVVPDKDDFLHFLKSRFHLYHQSNVFFRDLQYGLIAYCEAGKKKISYGSADALAAELAETLAVSGILRQVSPGTWVLNYPAFRKPPAKQEVLARAVPPANALAALASS
jgi:hypothetical protein